MVFVETNRDLSVNINYRHAKLSGFFHHFGARLFVNGYITLFILNAIVLKKIFSHQAIRAGWRGINYYFFWFSIHTINYIYNLVLSLLSSSKPKMPQIANRNIKTPEIIALQKAGVTKEYPRAQGEIKTHNPIIKLDQCMNFMVSFYHKTRVRAFRFIMYI